MNGKINVIKVYDTKVLFMDKKQEILKDLLKKIDECDDLIVEISQIRYWLEDIVKQIKQKKVKM